MQIYDGNCLTILKTFPAESVHCCITSPPYYGLRDYGMKEQIGLEQTPDEYVSALVSVFCEVRRVLRDDGTLWVNLGDSYVSSPTGADSKHSRLEGGKQTQHEGGKRSNKVNCGVPAKNLLGIPWRVAFALQKDGWILRQEIIWAKPNPMPESVKDRFTKSHESLFLFAKSGRYYFDQESVKETAVGSTKGAGASFRREKSKRGVSICPNSPSPTHRPDREDVRYDRDTRNRRSVWNVATVPYKGAHFATFPPALIEPCVMAGCPVGGVILDPFTGSGTTGMVAIQQGRDFIGIELNPEYVKLAQKRIAEKQDMLTGVL